MNFQCMIIAWVVFVMIYFGLGVFALLFSQGNIYCKSIASLVFLLSACAALKNSLNLQITDRLVSMLLTFFTVDFPLIFFIKLFWVHNQNTREQQDEENKKQLSTSLIRQTPINFTVREKEKKKNFYSTNSSNTGSSDQSGSEIFTNIDFDPQKNLMHVAQQSNKRSKSPELDDFSGSGSRCNSKNSLQLFSRNSSARGSINYGNCKIKKVFSSFSNDGIHYRDTGDNKQLKYQKINNDQSEMELLYQDENLNSSLKKSQNLHNVSRTSSSERRQNIENNKNQEKKIQENGKVYNYQPQQCSQILEDMKESQFTLQNYSDQSKQNNEENKQIDLSNMLNKKASANGKQGSECEILSNTSLGSVKVNQIKQQNKSEKNQAINNKHKQNNYNLQFLKKDPKKRSTVSKKSECKGQPSSYSECSGISFNL
ncbi:hypothetical protein PPERSA_09437 [Pseudocohnilembus persalinus]|uniref:Transmembrane protein n=1 Tax=Pseudocohnilembus persalinus TaxID=266149 RepID=A0A0V0Q9R2_PSEPJ|nr:hypothetical protein PPERSA_09437 [Pseudocohnilembus persalinus]|eukprot:KRW98912.1 hypothetical protein PPERSA_09437 [Pseudocohnilembus persalinus]